MSSQPGKYTTGNGVTFSLRENGDIRLEMEGLAGYYMARTIKAKDWEKIILAMTEDTIHETEPTLR